jgi:cell pole-organizing protein PopZ
MGQLNTEPSMEDILASIKRIIAEDSEAVGAKTPKARREAMAAVVSARPVAVEPEETAEPAETAAAAEPETPENPDVLELTSPMPEADTIPAAAARPAPPAGDPATDGLLSSPAAQASRNAFAALGQLQVRAEEGAPNTLDGLVADLLKPMLREWLDRELPAMVERLVSAEVARLSGRG